MRTERLVFVADTDSRGGVQGAKNESHPGRYFVLYLESDAQRKPTFDAELSGVFELRAATR